MGFLLLLLLALPFLATLLSIVLPRRATVAMTVVVGVVCFLACLPLVGAVAAGPVQVGRYLRVDAISVVFLIATAFLYATTSIYTVGYFAGRAREVRGRAERARPFNRYSRLFYVGFNAFAWTLLCAPLMNDLALLWVAIEITTVVSALLVALDRTDRATEAAWKYVLIASSGLGIALLATIILYYAGSQVLNDSQGLSFTTLAGAAHRLPHTPVELAFVLALVGYGTKVGLFPVHTWLPDAHSEAPTPVSVLLSGALLGTCFYAIVRYYQIAERDLGAGFPQRFLAVFGILSLLLAALYLFGQRDIKRMLSYSSVEHMGILAIGLSLGAPLALAGVLLHVLAHAAGKSTAFMGAGVLVHKFGTKTLSRMRDALTVLPWSGPFFLMAIFALCAFPPFGIFRSEFMIVGGGVLAGHHTVAVILMALITLAFFGLTLSTTRILFEPASHRSTSGPGQPLPAGGARQVGGALESNTQPAPDRPVSGPPATGLQAAAMHGTTRGGLALDASVSETGTTIGTLAAAASSVPRTPRGEPSMWMVVAMGLGLAALLLLGVHPGGGIVALLHAGAAELGGGAL